MFVYNSENDEYNELTPGYSKFCDDTKRLDPVLISVNSKRSSRCSSIKSYNDIFTRIITKNGRQNTHIIKVPNKHLVYFRDLGNTLLNIRWRWILLTLCMVNFVSFYLFGMLWMWLAYISGDFDEDVDTLCVVNTKSLTGYILLSIETMLTIGYGYRYPTEACIQGWILPFLQALVGVGIQGVLVSAVYVKISKPYTKNRVGLFSKKAVICLRDGSLCLIIRITDLLGKVAVGTNITIYFVDKDVSQNDIEPFRIQEIKVQSYGFLMFPLEIVHVIDSGSPLWKIQAHELLIKRFEIVVVAEGSSVITGQISQNRSSYINTDILWGHRFASCVDFDEKQGKFIVDNKNINKVLPFDTPLCSAYELSVLRKGLVL